MLAYVIVLLINCFCFIVCVCVICVYSGEFLNDSRDVSYKKIGKNPTYNYETITDIYST